MTPDEAITKLRQLQRTFDTFDPDDFQDHAVLNEAIDTVCEERTRLLLVLDAASTALKSCRDSMAGMVEKGVRSQTFRSQADQFAAAWRDLRSSVDAANNTENGIDRR